MVSRLILKAKNHPLYYMIPKKPKLEPRVCESCGVTYTPLTPLASVCYKCYKRSQRCKSYKLKKVAKLKTIDSTLDSMQKVSRPLTDSEKGTIAYMLGRFATIKEVQEYFKTDNNKEINYESIKSIRDSDKWKPIIEKERADWLAKIQDVPIANKRVRMEGWQNILDQGYKEKDMNTIKKALDGARTEMEGVYQQIGGNNYSLTYIANMTNNDLLKRKNEIMAKIKRLTSSIEKDSNEIELVPEIEEVSQDANN